ncbi:MAG: type II toxin-antitoxin system PemK/MazF family toxin [Patescibacteria group bacterium]
MKNFDEWNKKKKEIDTSYKHKNTHRGEIWWAFVGLNIGYEQNGGKRFQRPIIILKRVNYKLVLVAPLTSQVKNHESHFYYQFKNTKVKSTAIIPQIKIISTKRLHRKIEKISNGEYTNLIKTIYKFFLH